MSSSQPQAAIRRKLLASTRLAKPARARPSAKERGRALPRAWFMTDPKRTPDPAATIAQLPKGWGVVYRHFGATDRYATGAKLARICKQRGLTLLVSADPALAAAIGADGVHWPEKRLRGVRHRSPHFIETASAHSRASLARAHALKLDAAFLSAVFPSNSPSAGKALGPIRFRQIAHSSPLPVFALGGIDAQNVAQIAQHSAGWAAIEAVMSGWPGRP